MVGIVLEFELEGFVVVGDCDDDVDVRGMVELVLLFRL